MKKKIKGLWKILFGRTAILALLIMIQALVFVLGVLVLDSTIIIANNITGILSVLILIYLVNNRQNNSFKLMWIVIIVATPLIGVPFYVFTRIQPGRRILDGKLETLQEDQHDYLLPDNSIIKEMMNEENRELGLFKYLFERAHFPMYKDCGIKYFPLGENKYEELLKQLRRAKKFIFIEYFIIEKGLMWDSILEILQQKAREGVEVRLIYDGTNTLLRLPKNYPKKLEAMGIQCRVFSPLVPFMSTHQNNRDHRKIVVIDGHTAFTGGVNLADEYINAVKRFGHWKDTAIMVRGKAVNSFTLMFLQMWNVYDINKLERYDRYMFAGGPQDDSLDYGGYIAPYSDSPLDGEEVGKKVYLDILNRATRYVHIMTPYLILDEEMTNALTFAAERGIDVKLILPHIPDKKYVYYLARTHYSELISSGVKIYEYTPGFVHAKVFTSDDIKAVVGTINLDFRSLYLHFECAAYILDNPLVEDIEEDFENTLKDCKRITMNNCKNYSILGTACGKILRLVAPLM